ncbi:MAG TPA: RIP metalloprotease RseP [Bacillota bacterium]|jgi:regulator of sigma E protease|nr:RIP metalloprotease RseP [Fastidiosipila sp.]HPX93809.1 RIP metalloprotease RseP [Bacillota bacterium]HQB81634.1 RIP metalloprotease RseP [Bacillota bacterium]
MTFLGILAGVLILGLIMVIHELGHFLAGRAFGFKIDQFSIFMGPVLFEREKKGIRYNIKAIPLGASVSFAGEESEIEGQTDGALEYDREDPDLFENRPRWQRAIVIAMGPALNFLTAFVVFIILFTAKGAVIPKVGAIPPDTLMAGTSIKAGDTITSLDGTRIRTALDLTIAEMNHDAGDPWLIGYRTATGDKGLETVLPAKAPPRPMLGITYQTEGDQHLVVSVHPDADRGEAGLLPGDQILTIEGIPFGDTDRVTETILASGEKAIRLEIIRKGKPLSLEISPLIIEADLPLGLVLTLSKKAESVISQGVRYPISVFRTTVRGIGMLFAGKIGVRDSFAGPIAIVSMAADTVKQGRSLGDTAANLATLLGLLSVAIGFTNLLPIPPLDGNHLLLLGVEAVRRKPLSAKFKSITGMAGLIFFIVLGVAVVTLDLVRLFGW